MQFTKVILAALATVASANVINARQGGCGIGTLPQCARTCMNEVAPQMGCGNNDPKCLCKDLNKLKVVGRDCAIRECGGSAPALDMFEKVKGVCARCG
ncbi:hypothetical protein VTJ04DRAFT_7650 [Mycothermus thermophilus]|uniref:uncharacterized protein n=1 Tax=Humicola insolens TaxID=85995 RepID=UPI0037437DAE